MLQTYWTLKFPWANHVLGLHASVCVIPSSYNPLFSVICLRPHVLYCHLHSPLLPCRDLEGRREKEASILEGHGSQIWQLHRLEELNLSSSFKALVAWCSTFTGLSMNFCFEVVTETRWLLRCLCGPWLLDLLPVFRLKSLVTVSERLQLEDQTFTLSAPLVFE